MTPTCVTLNRRGGFASNPSAARAATLPSSASCRKRDRRTETSDTSAAAKKPFSVTITASKINLNGIS